MPVTYNDPPLTDWGTNSLKNGLDTQRVTEVRPVMGAEDFSYLAQVVPGMFFFLGVVPPDVDPLQAPANHSPLLPRPRARAQVRRARAQLSRDRLSEAGASHRPIRRSAASHGPRKASAF